MIDEQKDLEKRFAELRAEESRFAPRFDPHVRGARRFSPRRLAMAAAALVVLSFGVVVGVRDRTHLTTFDQSDLFAVRAADTWRAPTDFLLQTPGNELLTTTPPIPDPSIVPPPSKGSSL